MNTTNSALRAGTGCPSATLLLGLILTLAACAGSGSTGGEPTATGDAAVTETSGSGTSSSSSAAGTSGSDTTAGVEAAQWGDNVNITMSGDSFRFESNGLPNHELPDQFMVPQTGSFTPPVTEDEVSAVDTAIAVVESPVDQSFPLRPTYSETTTDTNLGLIGVVISGAQLFNDYEDPDRAFVAVDDNFSVGGVGFVDACNGHPLALRADGTGSGNYHYHGVPYCITDAVDQAGEHSSILGFLRDGFPFYGPNDEGGITITSDDLDECSGHVGPTPEFPEGIYHYHLTEDRSPYTIDCYHGVVESTGEGAGGRPDGDRPARPGGDEEGQGRGGPPDFSEAAATLGVSEADLTAALGAPPFDLDATAAALGVSVADLEAAIPPPPGGGPGGERPEREPAAAPTDETTTGLADVDPDELAERTDVALGAAWADNVTITVDGATMVFESNGLPSHEYLDVYLGDGRDGKFVAGGVEAYDARHVIPLVPTPAVTPAETGNGAIGVAISGAVFFDPYEGDGSATVANDDNETIDGIPFIDACGGHPIPNGLTYHYHGIPFCITDAVDTPGEHSALIGYLFDGYPMYGPQDVGGAEPTDLDACLGHVGPTPDFEGDTYHYHVISTSNYISECYAGNATAQARGR